MSKRHRTTFPTRCNFSGWWVQTEGSIGMLVKCGTNIRMQVIYNLWFPKTKVTGNGIWTTELLTEAGGTITREEPRTTTAGSLVERVRNKAQRGAEREMAELSLSVL